MKQILFAISILMVEIIFTSCVLSRDSTELRSTLDRSISNQIKTGDTLSGIYYYLKIIPADTSNIDRMPSIPSNEFTTVDVQPVPILQVPPKYPELAYRAGIEGTVWIKCLIDTRGRVKKAEVLKSDNEILNQAAIDAAVQWIFKPAMLYGNPVEVWAAIPIRFRLKN